MSQSVRRFAAVGQRHVRIAARRAASQTLTEMLERRSMMCATDPVMDDHALGNALMPATVDHDAAWYKPVKSSSATSDGGSATSDTDPTWTTNAAGLPLLTQRADGGGLKIFLDFDGYNTDTPFSTDADGSTFNASEQKVIYDTYRDIVSFFSPLNVNVTTIQPPIGGTNPNFVWQRISNSISGGAAYVGWLTNNSSQGWTGSENATGRHSGIAHEIGHQLGLNHQSEYDMYGNKTQEYTDGFDSRDRAVIGIDYAENVRTWFYGRDATSASNLVDDLAVMASHVSSVVGGDGFRPDDYGNSLLTATNLGTGGTLSGDLERLSDSDYFKFTTTTGGAYQLAATPTFESAASPKIELLDSTGKVVAGRDDADQRNWNDNAQDISINLAPGTYYLRVASSGDAGETGEYLMTAAPIGVTADSGWASTDVGANAIYRGGTAAFDPTTGILTQVGGGTDIWTNVDQMRYTYTTLTGDGSITARVDSLDYVGYHTKAGVDIRQGLATNAAHVFMGLKASNLTDPIARSTAGANAYNAGTPTATTDRWVRLVRSGNTFTLFSSGDGISWNSVGSTNVTMSGPVYIGLATSAWSARAQAYSQFSNISLTGNIGTAAPTYNTLSAPVINAIAPNAGASTGINLAWNAVASATGYIVQRSVDGVTFNDVATLGATVLSYADAALFGSMRYFYRVAALATDSTRSTPSAAATTINKPQAPAAPNSGYAPVFMTPSTSQILLNWSDVQGDAGYKVERSSDGGTTYAQIGTTPANATGYNDSNLAAGTTYKYRVTPITGIGDSVTPSLIITASTELAQVTGFHYTALTSNSASLAWNDAPVETGYRVQRSTDHATWTTVATLGANVTSYTDSGLSAVTSYYYRLVAFNPQIDGVESIIFGATPATTALPSGWTAGDVGPVSGQGVSSYSGTTWTLIGSGNDIYDATDSFQYARRVVNGDASISARVPSFENNQDYSKAGLMFRATTDANSINVNLAYTPNGGVELNYRGSTGGGTATFARVDVTGGPVWLKLIRAGNTFTGSYSTDNVTWTAVGSVSVGLPSTAMMGLSVTSHNTSMLSKATFDNIVASGVSTGIAPTIVTAATATPSPVTGTTTTLKVTATDDGGAAALTYTWGFVTKPSAAAAPTFSVNGTNGASTSVATFTSSGTYTLRVTVKDGEGLTVTSSAFVIVQPTLSSLSISPSSSPTVAPGGTQTFTAVARDQFGNAMSLGAGGWAADVGSIDANGVWTAPTDAGVATVTLTKGSITATRTVQTNLAVSSDRYDFDASVPQLSFAFNAPVLSGLDPSDIVLNQIAADGTTVLQTIAASSIGVNFDSVSRTAQFTFPGLPNGTLPDGNYRATFSANSVTASGAALAADASLDFFVLAGDMDRNRTVDFSDLLTLARNYGNSAATYSQGNIDYSADATVGFSDLLILARNYGMNMPAPTTPVPAVSAPAATMTSATADVVAQSSATTTRKRPAATVL